MSTIVLLLLDNGLKPPFLSIFNFSFNALLKAASSDSPLKVNLIVFPVDLSLPKVNIALGVIEK